MLAPDLAPTKVVGLEHYFGTLDASQTVARWMGGLLIDRVAYAIDHWDGLTPAQYATVTHRLIQDCRQGIDSVTQQPFLPLEMAKVVGDNPTVYRVEANAAAQFAFGKAFADASRQWYWHALVPKANATGP